MLLPSLVHRFPTCWEWCFLRAHRCPLYSILALKEWKLHCSEINVPPDSQLIGLSEATARLTQGTKRWPSWHNQDQQLILQGEAGCQLTPHPCFAPSLAPSCFPHSLPPESTPQSTPYRSLPISDSTSRDPSPRQDHS